MFSFEPSRSLLILSQRHSACIFIRGNITICFGLNHEKYLIRICGYRVRRNSRAAPHQQSWDAFLAWLATNSRRICPRSSQIRHTSSAMHCSTSIIDFVAMPSYVCLVIVLQHRRSAEALLPLQEKFASIYSHLSQTDRSH